MKKTIIYISLILVLGCGGFDEMIDLGQGYFYFGEGTPSNYIFKGKKEKSGFEWTIYKRVIEANVTSFTFDNDYILVFQEPSHSAAADAVVYQNYKLPLNSEAEIKAELQKADSIIKKSSYWNKIFSHKHNYYIIDKKHDKIYGPLTKKTFLQKKDSIGISKKLKL